MEAAILWRVGLLAARLAKHRDPLGRLIPGPGFRRGKKLRG